mgnify:CR=1 FL=1
MSNEKENLNEKPPSGPWDIPLKDFVKSFKLKISIFDLKNDKLIDSQEIDYGNYEHRKFLGRVTFWATSNGYSVETMALADYEKFK